jgi:hypothetical protein
MDTLYYSNYCKHSQRILQFLVKGNLEKKINFLCIDNRERDPKNNQLYIILEDGKRVSMPPNVQSVPSLLLVRQGYRVILGDDIIGHYHVDANRESKKMISNQVREPLETGFISNGGMNIMSESYTAYDLTPEELSAKGNSGRRNMNNYVSANDDIISIQTPPDTYQPDKISNNVTVDTIQQKRIDEIESNRNNNIHSSI